MSEHWRVGRSQGRTLYIHHGDDPEGAMVAITIGPYTDAAPLAQAICDAMNARQRADQAEATIQRVRDLLTAVEVRAIQDGHDHVIIAVRNIRFALDQPTPGGAE